MNKTIRILTSVALLALSACSPLIYGKLDAPTVAVTQKLPLTVPGYTGPALTVPADLLPPFDFTLGEVTVDASSKDSSIKLNDASVTITTVDATVTFQGMETVVLMLVPRTGTAQTVAKYDKANKIGSLSTDGKTLTLAPTSDLELLGFLSGKSLSVKIGGTGTPPGKAWDGNVTLDLHIIAQENVL